MRNVIGIVLLCVLFASGGTARAEFRVANIFSDNMVLQRDKPIRIWGWTKPKARVEVALTEDRAEALAKVGEGAFVRTVEDKGARPRKKAADESEASPTVRLAYFQHNIPPAKTRDAQVTADKDGYWQVELGALHGSFTPKYLLVCCGKQRVAFQNILIGEVWVTAGQSNMAWAGARENIWEKEGLILNGVRYTTHRDSWYRPKDDLSERSDWLVCEDGELARISAIPYMFGKFVHRKLKVPVGIINAATGGSYGNNWASREQLKKIDLQVIKDMLAANDERVGPWTSQQGRAKVFAGARAAFEEEMEQWRLQADAARKAGKRPPRPPKFKAPGDRRAGGGPGYLFHGRVSSVARLSVRGAMFLQGEQQSLGGAKWSQYEQVFPAVVRSFREAFNDPKLPFGIITLQGMGVRGNTPEVDATTNGYTNVRDIHYRTHLAMPNTGFICAHDVGGGVHPNWKRPVAERAAYWALRDVYKAIRPPRTRLKTVQFEKGKVIVTFEQERWGMDRDTRKQEWRKVERPVVPPSNDGMALDGFAVAGKDRRWYPTKVTIDWTRRCLVVWSDLVKAPVALRYGWGGYPQANLGDWYDPIPPFRTDDWPVFKVGLGTAEENKLDRNRKFVVQNAAKRRQMDREIRQALHDIHILELKLYGDPKRILRSKVSRIGMVLDEMNAAYFGEEAKRLSAAALADICAQYYKPEGLLNLKWRLQFDQAVRLDVLPASMAGVLRRQSLQQQIAATRDALKTIQTELAKLPDPKPVTYELAEGLLNRAKKSLTKRGIDWRKIVRGDTPITAEDLKEQE